MRSDSFLAAMRYATALYVFPDNDGWEPESREEEGRHVGGGKSAI